MTAPFASVSQALELLIPPFEDDRDDWEQIAAEAHRQGALAPERPRRRVRPRTLVLVAFVVLIVGAASAFGLGVRPTINFFAAKKGPSWAFVSYENGPKITELFSGAKRQQISLAAPARQITDVRFEGRDHVLVVAPLKGGGYCDSWRGPYLSGNCVASRPGPTSKTINVQVPGGGSGPIDIYGSFVQPSGARLEVAFQDGATAQIAAVWVSAPISAGFFLYNIPSAHRRPGHVPVSLSLLDSSGHMIANAKLPTFPAFAKPLLRNVPGFGIERIPPQAIYARRQLLFQATITTFTHRPIGPSTLRQRVGLWIAPSTTGGTCLWEGGTISGGISGCGQHQRPLPPLPIAPNFYFDTLCCQVGLGVARIELRFQDGDRIEVYPEKTYILAAIPLHHFAPGHRFTEEVAYSQSGKVLAERTFPTNQPGMYPCANPNVKVDGVEMCP
jgi:hypothetical protein